MAAVGLPDAAVNESRERVRAAIKNSGFLFPYEKRVTVNLASGGRAQGRTELRSAHRHRGARRDQADPG